MSIESSFFFFFLTSVVLTVWTDVGTLRKMIEVAEQALEALEERDKLAVFHGGKNENDKKEEKHPESIMVLPPDSGGRTP